VILYFNPEFFFSFALQWIFNILHLSKIFERLIYLEFCVPCFLYFVLFPFFMLFLSYQDFLEVFSPIIIFNLLFLLHLFDVLNQSFIMSRPRFLNFFGFLLRKKLILERSCLFFVETLYTVFKGLKFFFICPNFCAKFKHFETVFVHSPSLLNHRQCHFQLWLYICMQCRLF